MAIFKCKMCGGSLEINGNETVVNCEYCGTMQTLPKLTDERKVNLYDRANHFRRNNEYDKAMSIYEQILNEDTTDAEAYWSLVLCKYGIEYVEDPVSKKRVPTVNRTQNTAIFDDVNYKSALEYADAVQRGVYEAEAKAINEIQKGILEISLKEKPFDIFICYKETDENGKRTPDSVLANDLYHQLTREGYKVFFARITLEDKLGTAYEPYIFAALNSAKVMIVIGTKPEYFQAVWVKNEWSRYLSLIKNGAEKMLIPAYRDMDPYDLPEEFAHLQSQDMSKLGCVQDIIHGIKKIIKKEEPAVARQVEVVTAPAASGVSIQSLMERVQMFIDDESWDDADVYCEKILDIDPKNGKAYIYKLLAENEVTSTEKLKYCKNNFTGSNNYEKAIRFCDEITVDNLKACAKANADYREELRKEKLYRDAMNKLNGAEIKDECLSAKQMFIGLGSYSDAAEKAKECDEKIIKLAQAAEDRRKDEIYNSAKTSMKGSNVDSYNRAIAILNTIPDWKDSAALISFCQDKIEELEAKKGERKKKGKKVRRGCLVSVIAFFVGIILFIMFGIPAILNVVGNGYMDEENYVEAEAVYGISGLLGNKKASEKCIDCATKLIEQSVAEGYCYETFSHLERYSLDGSTLWAISAKDYIAAQRDAFFAEGNYLMAALLYYYEDPSHEMLEECQKKMLENAKIGDIVFFGKMQQSPIFEAKELVLWKVVDIVDGKLMLVSALALDFQRFGEDDSNWETSNIRTYLNGEFYDSTFSESEKAHIALSVIDNSFAPEDGDIVKQNFTQDKVYLLSKQECLDYFADDEDRICYATELVAKENVKFYDSNSYYKVDYLTRNPKIYVKYGGGIAENGSKTVSSYIRPVMWVAP